MDIRIPAEEIDCWDTITEPDIPTIEEFLRYHGCEEVLKTIGKRNAYLWLMNLPLEKYP